MEHERARMWVDLVKTARKQRIWDLCRKSTIFCLLYDDGIWKPLEEEPEVEEEEVTFQTEEQQVKQQPQEPNAKADVSTIDVIVGSSSEDSNLSQGNNLQYEQQLIVNLQNGKLYTRARRSELLMRGGLRPLRPKRRRPVERAAVNHCLH